MGISVLVTRDYDHMSEVAAGILMDDITRCLKLGKEFVLGLATGNSPVGLYRKLARSANSGLFDASRVRSFNLDEYVGLPGDNPQERSMHPQSYCFFMIRELFGLMDRKFSKSSLPCASLIDSVRLARELAEHPGDWKREGAGAGRAISIEPAARSEYLSWVKSYILDGYQRQIREAGGIDTQVIGVGEMGHVGFHEAGIPFAGAGVLLVELDVNTAENAVSDGHFSSVEEAPRYAVSMGAELIYQAGKVLLLASGERKSRVVAQSLLGSPTPGIPLSYGQIYAGNGGHMTYVVDRIAGSQLLGAEKVLREKKIDIRLIDPA